jgi:hypothetical protein
MVGEGPILAFAAWEKAWMPTCVGMTGRLGMTGGSA